MIFPFFKFAYNDFIRFFVHGKKCRPVRQWRNIYLSYIKALSFTLYSEKTKDNHSDTNAVNFATKRGNFLELIPALMTQNAILSAPPLLPIIMFGASLRYHLSRCITKNNEFQLRKNDFERCELCISNT